MKPIGCIVGSLLASKRSVDFLLGWEAGRTVSVQQRLVRGHSGGGSMNIRHTRRHFGSQTLLSVVLLAGTSLFAQTPPVRADVPRTWDDAAMAALEVPLANPIGSPRQVQAEYYYKIPVRKIYKQYPVYAPGREPAGYLDWLKRQEPVLLWDDAGRKPQLRT